MVSAVGSLYVVQLHWGVIDVTFLFISLISDRHCLHTRTAVQHKPCKYCAVVGSLHLAYISSAILKSLIRPNEKTTRLN